MNVKNLSWQNGLVFVVILGLTILAAFKPSLGSDVALAISALGGLVTPSPIAPPEQIALRTTVADKREFRRALHLNHEDKTQ